MQARWTKCDGTVSDVLLCLLCHGLLIRCWKVWHADPKVAAEYAAVAGVDTITLEGADDSDWRKLRRSRSLRLQSFLSDCATVANMISLHLVMSPARRLSAWLLKHRPLTLDAGDWPPLVDFVNRTESPVTTALADYAGLLRADAAWAQNRGKREGGKGRERETERLTGRVSQTCLNKANVSNGGWPRITGCGGLWPSRNLQPPACSAASSSCTFQRSFTCGWTVA